MSTARIIKTAPAPAWFAVTWTRWEVDAHSQRPTGGQLSFTESWPGRNADEVESVWYTEYAEAADRGDAVLQSITREQPRRVRHPAPWESV